MKIVLDLEANGLNPTEIWCIVCKDIETEKEYVFDKPTRTSSGDGFVHLLDSCSLVVGHNIIGYDLPVLARLIPGTAAYLDKVPVVDTLVVSRTVDYNRRGGHGLAAWGKIVGLDKPEIRNEQWAEYDPVFIHRCQVDTEINLRVYKELLPYIASARWATALRVEHDMARICEQMHNTGLDFSVDNAHILLKELKDRVLVLYNLLKNILPKKLKVLKEIVPRRTKHGTLNKQDFYWWIKENGPDLSPFNGGPFSRIEFEEFDPGSPKQRVERLWEAGWRPINKTQTHKDVLKEIRGLQRSKRIVPPELLQRLDRLKVYGWTVDEENLSTLPKDAPQPMHDLVQYMMLRNRVSTIESWLAAVEDDGRVHGSFNHIGAWTHRMSHDRPNLGNIPRFNAKDPGTTPYSDKMRSLWRAGQNEYLVGVDAESIQLRVFAHYIDDQEFTNSLICGRKEDGTDPHSVNQRALGEVCRSRDAAKTFIYAWLLGAGVAKVANILSCDRGDAEESIGRFIARYPGLAYLKREVIPVDASQGWFVGFDGRAVRTKGDDQDTREHYMLGGYLQCGEAVVMKHACIRWTNQLKAEGIPFRLVNFVHDEWQIAVPRDYELALYVANTAADSIRLVGEELNLRCPFAGSILNGEGKVAIGDNWQETH